MRFITLGLLLLCLNTAALGQAETESDDNVSINVSAKIISTIELTTVQSMNLSQVDAVEGVIQLNPIQNANSGKMIASGTPHSKVRISYIQSRQLTHPESTQPLEFQYSVAVNDQDNQASAELLNTENREFEFNSEGDLYLWIGGQVDITNAAPGQYQGEFTLDIENI